MDLTFEQKTELFLTDDIAKNRFDSIRDNLGD